MRTRTVNRLGTWLSVVALWGCCGGANAQWCTLVGVGYSGTNFKWSADTGWFRSEGDPSNDVTWAKGVLEAEKDAGVRQKKADVLLQAAAYWGKKDTCQWLLSVKANPNHSDEEGKTALHYAAILNPCEMGSEAVCSQQFVQTKTETCALLLEHGAKVNARDGKGYTCGGDTPLHYATILFFASPAQELRLAMCELLLAKGADVSITNAEGRTALHNLLCSQWGCEPIKTCRLLVARGAKVDAQDTSGATPLTLAAEHGWVNIYRFLLTNSVHAAGVDKMGRTPLHLAAMEGHTNVCETLIAVGADIGAKDKDGKTPADLAADKPLAEFLRRSEKRKSAGKR